ncbi:hypothetical protein IYZ83_002855 [Wolbachia pipientis]|uniref:hypothetical protein n=1 Tax=Wolbachia pipientis TaxID=955 RepID=UPI001BD9C3EA|nr:hypothetical protein [Wolbachia pipientis]UIP92222.1 hypothetical protein IYZ83_002855 [Wolbachia pipientis]
MTRIICVASVVYFKIRFFFEIYYHENSNFPFAAGLQMKVTIGATVEVKRITHLCCIAKKMGC